MDRETTYKIRGKAHIDITVWESEKLNTAYIQYDGFLDRYDSNARYINRTFDVPTFEDGIDRAMKYIKRHNFEISTK